MSYKRLPELFNKVPVQPNNSIPEIDINGITQDSRKVKEGNLFIAIKGGTTDGHKFLNDAFQRGAAAVIGSDPEYKSLPLYVQVDDSRKALAYLSSAFYDFPSKNLLMIGVTGTDGKTTTANLIFEILAYSGIKTGLVSTIQAVIGDKTLDTGFHVTTPGADEIQRYLATMVENDIKTVIIEVTSHGLEQGRVTACDFDIGVITNVAHEHLDYHGTYEAYLAAKGKLIKNLRSSAKKLFATPRAAVLNMDDRSYQFMSNIAGTDQISYGFDPSANINASNVKITEQGTTFICNGININGDKFSIPIKLNLLGAFNVSNCLAAISVTKALIGLRDNQIQNGIEELRLVPGRMERIDMGQDFTAMVDFAHTPNALKNALKLLRTIVKGRIISIFGSAGLRDKEKRRMMAEISADMSAITILTAEDPRIESLDEILAEMADGVISRSGIEGKTFWRIPDRGDAIRFGIGLAISGDLVVAFGKGHEQSMCFGETEYAWDDRIAMKAAIAEQLGISGPKMPYLPTQKR